MTARNHLLTLLLPLLAFACCGPEPKTETRPGNLLDNRPSTTESNMSDTPEPKPAPHAATPTHATPQTATLASGCFWCTEAVLEQLNGVLSVQSGYMGGNVDNPTYEQICSGTTEHAEVVQVTFDSERISYEKLLEWFFRSHDPTTRNRQGNDVGTQYRSAIFFHSKQQQMTALKLMKQIAANWSDPIVTELTPAVTFWPAEAYHQDYFRNNQSQGYCRAVIMPKLTKLGLDPAPKK